VIIQEWYALNDQIKTPLAVAISAARIGSPVTWRLCRISTGVAPHADGHLSKIATDNAARSVGTSPKGQLGDNKLSFRWIISDEYFAK
jgi:hypothetical protein